MINPPQQGRPAVKWGLIFGGILAAVSLISSLVQYMTGGYNQLSDPTAAQARMGTYLLLGCGSFIVEAALYFFAGMLAARENGKVGSGALAGLITAAVGLLASGVTAILVLPNISTTPPPGTDIDPAQYAAIVRVATIVAIGIGAVIGLGIGTGIAALGGLVGRGQYNAAHPLQGMEGSMYMPMYPAGVPSPYAPPAGYPPPGAPGAYPPPTTPTPDGPDQNPPASSAYPPPPDAPQEPQ